MAEPRCPVCGTPIESREPFDRYQNTRLNPCNHVVSAGEIQVAHEDNGT